MSERSKVKKGNFSSIAWETRFPPQFDKTFRSAATTAAALKLHIVDWFELRPAEKLSVPWRPDSLAVPAPVNENRGRFCIKSNREINLLCFVYAAAMIHWRLDMSNFVQPLPRNAAFID
jgi:hypothetical protein